MSRAEEKARALNSQITGVGQVIDLVTEHANDVTALWYAYELAQRAFTEWEGQSHPAAYKITTTAGELMAEIVDMINTIEKGGN